MSAGERIVRLWVEAYIVDRSAQQIEISFGKCARAPNTAIVGGVCGRKSSCRDTSKLKPLPPQTDKPQGHSLESPLKSKFHAHNKPACIANQGAASLTTSPAIACPFAHHCLASPNQVYWLLFCCEILLKVAWRARECRSLCQSDYIVISPKRLLY